jgi:hypothetical protein
MTPHAEIPEKSMQTRGSLLPLLVRLVCITVACLLLPVVPA